MFLMVYFIFFHNLVILKNKELKNIKNIFEKIKERSN